MSVVILRNEIVHYEVLGRGKPLIFLHGWVGSWRYWISTMQAASVSFRAYAIDLWGFGDTSKCPDHYLLEGQLSLLDGFLEEMGMAKVAIIGHGLGAALGLLYATRFPRFVDRLMLVGLPLSIGQINPRLSTTDPGDLVDWLLGKNLLNEPVRTEASKTDPGAIQTTLTAVQHLDLAKLIANCPPPCLLVNGQNDPVVQAPSSLEIAVLPEHLHQVTFENSGHFPMLDEATPFNRLMADFLALNSGASPRQLQLKEEWRRRVR